MHDWWTHTEVMLAGMWGGTGGVLPPLQTLLQDFRPAALANWHLDQWFLRAQVWPTARQSCLIHDSKLSAVGSKDFPAYGELPEGHHVGQNASALKSKTFNITIPAPDPPPPAPGGAGRSGGGLLLPCPA